MSNTNFLEINNLKTNNVVILLFQITVSQRVRSNETLLEARLWYVFNATSYFHTFPEMLCNVASQ